MNDVNVPRVDLGPLRRLDQLPYYQAIPARHYENTNSDIVTINQVVKF